MTLLYVWIATTFKRTRLSHLIRNFRRNNENKSSYKANGSNVEKWAVWICSLQFRNIANIECYQLLERLRGNLCMRFNKKKTTFGCFKQSRPWSPLWLGWTIAVLDGWNGNVEICLQMNKREYFFICLNDFKIQLWLCNKSSSRFWSTHFHLVRMGISSMDLGRQLFLDTHCWPDGGKFDSDHFLHAHSF